MAANPDLLAFGDTFSPKLYENEIVALSRPRVTFESNNLRTPTGTWSAAGTAYLTNFRIVFVADKQDTSGLLAFDLPLAYHRREKVNQPIFGANNITAEVWPLATGPNGSEPPYQVKLTFKEGGMGTFVQFFLCLLEHARNALYEAGGDYRRRPDPSAPNMDQVNAALHRAYVDPNDPSTIFISRPPPPAGEAGQARKEGGYVFAKEQDSDDKKYESF